MRLFLLPITRQMTPTLLFRAAVRSRAPALLNSARLTSRAASPSTHAFPAAACAFSTSVRRPAHDPHGEETFEEFNARYEKEFDQVQDVFDLQRNLNNCFAYDLVPSTSVITAALRAARRVNDFPTAVRTFEAIKAKVENVGQYEQYLQELEPLRKELGIDLKETLWPNMPTVT